MSKDVVLKTCGLLLLLLLLISMSDLRQTRFLSRFMDVFTHALLCACPQQQQKRRKDTPFWSALRETQDYPKLAFSLSQY